MPGSDLASKSYSSLLRHLTSIFVLYFFIQFNFFIHKGFFWHKNKKRHPSLKTPHPCRNSGNNLNKTQKHGLPTHRPNTKKVTVHINTSSVQSTSPASPYASAKSLYNRAMALLSDDEVIFLESLPRAAFESRLRALWKSGWSLNTLGQSLKPPRPKTTIHFWVRRAADEEQIRTIPAPPKKSLAAETPTKKPPRLRSVSPGVPQDMKPKLRELASQARRYRARTPASSPFAQANEELTTIALTLRSMGVPTAAIAEAAGVSYRAMAKRLSKHQK